MSSDTIEGIGLEQLDDIVSQGLYESSPYRFILERHTSKYVRIRDRIGTRMALCTLLELYLYACQSTKHDYDEALLPTHFCLYYIGIMDFVLNYDRAYERLALPNVHSQFRPDAPRKDFAHNFERFCASIPSPDAHRFLVAAVIALCRDLESYLWKALSSTTPPEGANAVTDCVNSLMSVEEYAAMLSNDGLVKDRLRIWTGANQEEMNVLSELYMTAVEADLEESSQYSPDTIKELLKEFCRESLVLNREMIHIAHNPDEQPQVSPECEDFICHLLRKLEDEIGDYSLNSFDGKFSEATRYALKGACRLITDTRCNAVWPLVAWLIRVHRLQLEWKSADLSAEIS